MTAETLRSQVSEIEAQAIVLIRENLERINRDFLGETDEDNLEFFSFGTISNQEIIGVTKDGYFVQNDYYSGHGATKKELSIRMAINENVVSVLDALCLLEELEAL